MSLPQGLTTVTPLSRRLALLLFILLPVLAFLWGMKFQELKSEGKKFNLKFTYTEPTVFREKIEPGVVLVSFSDNVTSEAIDQFFTSQNLSYTPLTKINNPWALTNPTSDKLDTVKEKFSKFEEVITVKRDILPSTFAISFKSQLTRSQAEAIFTQAGYTMRGYFRSTYFIAKVPVGREYEYVDIFTSSPLVYSAIVNCQNCVGVDDEIIPEN